MNTTTPTAQLHTITPTNDKMFITKRLAAAEVISQIQNTKFFIMFFTTLYCVNLIFRTKFTTYSMIVDAVTFGVCAGTFYMAHKKSKNLQQKYTTS